MSETQFFHLVWSGVCLIGLLIGSVGFGLIAWGLDGGTFLHCLVAAAKVCAGIVVIVWPIISLCYWMEVCPMRTVFELLRVPPNSWTAAEACEFLRASRAKEIKAEYYDALHCAEKRRIHEMEKEYKAAENSSAVNHPQHYGGADNLYEAIKVIEAWGLGFCLGNSAKYIARAGKKGGATRLEDLKKARWYLDREIAAEERKDGAQSS